MLSRLNINRTIRITYRSDNNLSFFTDHIYEMAEKYLSAESVLRDCRNTKNEANLPLRGKILNVEKSALVKLGENKEIKHLREALGEAPYRYQYIKQVCDADCLSGDTLIYYRDFNDNICE